MQATARSISRQAAAFSWNHNPGGPSGGVPTPYGKNPGCVNAGHRAVHVGTSGSVPNRPRVRSFHCHAEPTPQSVDLQATKRSCTLTFSGVAFILLPTTPTVCGVL